MSEKILFALSENFLASSGWAVNSCILISRIKIEFEVDIDQCTINIQHYDDNYKIQNNLIKGLFPQAIKKNIRKTAIFIKQKN